MSPSQLPADLPDPEVPLVLHEAIDLLITGLANLQELIRLTFDGRLSDAQVIATTEPLRDCLQQLGEMKLVQLGG